MADAEKHFTTAAESKSRGRPSIAGTLALAALHCRKQQFREAVQLCALCCLMTRCLTLSWSDAPRCRYSEAIRLQPGCGAEVRLGLGLCYSKLGNLKLARNCFERVLQLEPRTSLALLGLATLAFKETAGG